MSGLAPQPQRDLGGVRVQRLQAAADREVGGALGGRTEPLRGGVDPDRHADPVGRLAQGRSEPGLVQQGRVDLARDVAQLLQHRVQLVLQGVDGGVQLGLGHRGAVPDQADLEGERGDPQRGAVVQLAFQPAAAQPLVPLGAAAGLRQRSRGRRTAEARRDVSELPCSGAVRGASPARCAGSSIMQVFCGQRPPPGYREHPTRGRAFPRKTFQFTIAGNAAHPGPDRPAYRAARRRRGLPPRSRPRNDIRRRGDGERVPRRDVHPRRPHRGDPGRGLPRRRRQPRLRGRRRPARGEPARTGSGASSSAASATRRRSCSAAPRTR